MRILIAEDEALTRMGLRTVLREMGHVVVAAAGDGTTALRLILETRPDLALLDIKMPGLDGLAVAEAVAERGPVPIVLLTAYSERELVSRAAATPSVQAYLVKPVREADLAPTFELAVARFAEWQALREQATDLQAALAAREVLARAKAALMQRHGLTESAAFLEIQHRARRQRHTMLQAAEAILADSGEEGPAETSQTAQPPV